MGGNRERKGSHLPARPCRLRAPRREIREPDPASPYYFDEDVGERPILFAERFCKQSQGVIGAPLKLELFQKAYIQALFGFLERETGFRRYRETMFLVGRKNGKSTLLAAIALYMLIADYEGAAEIYSVATKRDQAKKVLTEAINMVKQSPELRAVLKKRRNDLYFPATASTFEALASDSNTLDGLNSHAVIIDELHAIKDRGLYEVMKQSTSSRRQPLVVMITTAGTVRESVFDSLYEIACRIADGEMEEPTFLPILYELDAREEWTDPTKWQKANPGLGTIKKYKTLADFVQRAKNSPDDLPGVLCKDFNIREVSAAVWLSFDAIKSDLRFEFQDVYNTYALGGCDLSATTDLTAATLLIRKPGDPIVYVLQQYFLPEKRVAHLEGEEHQRGPISKMGRPRPPHNLPGKPRQLFRRHGLVLPNAGRVQNRLHKSRLRPALAGYWVDEMKSNGFDMEAVAQGPYTWSQPMREMGAALEGKQINYNGNPMLVWCLTNTGVKKSGLNNIQPVKITEKRRIDGMVSLLNAWTIYVKYYEDFMYNVG